MYRLAIIELTGSARFKWRIPTWQGLACFITTTNLRSTTTDSWLEVHPSKRQACAHMFRSWDCTTALVLSFALLSILSCLSMIPLCGNCKDLKHTKNHVACESSISKADRVTVHKMKNIVLFSFFFLSFCFLFFSFLPVRWSILLTYLRSIMLALMFMITIKFTT